MDKKFPPEANQSITGKIFFAFFFLLIIGSVAMTYWRIMVKKDYIIESQVDCDPEAEKCFVWECDPESSEEGEACVGDPEKDIWYYQIAKRKAYEIPLCDPEKDESCLPMDCDPKAEEGCEKVFCDEETKIAQEVECSDPEEYLKNNPSEPEEDLSETECEEGDETCIEQEENMGEEDSEEENEINLFPTEDTEDTEDTEEAVPPNADSQTENSNIEDGE